MSQDHIKRSGFTDGVVLSPTLCRICAIEYTHDDPMNNLLTSIHNGIHFVDMLQNVILQRSIAKDSGFPLSICLDCTTNLILAYNFHEMCNGSERKFREMLGYHQETDEFKRKFIDESESDAKQSYFVDCAAIDVLNVNCNETDDGDGRVTRPQRERKLNSTRMPRYECYLCKETFTRIVHLRQHVINCHRYTDGKLWTCSECQKSFSQRKSLMKHLYKHTSTNCEHCPDTFTTLRELQQHSRRIHQDQLILHQCDRCPKKFVLKAQLRIHMHNHLDSHNQQFRCNVCSEIFVSELQLKGHTRAVHTTYLCSECGKTFKNNSLLSSHQKVHKSEKPFVCSKCPSRFKWKVALTYHMTIHQQERKHVCETCGLSFTTRSAMKGHMRIHSGERPFACDKCSKRFYRSTHLKRHNLSHTGEKPHLCKYCDKGFRQSAQLNKHLRLHVGENTYQCDLCPKKFKFKADMKKHFHEHYETKDSTVGIVARELPTENEVAECCK